MNKAAMNKFAHLWNIHALIFLVLYLGVELLAHIVDACLAQVDSVHVSKWIYQFTFPPVMSMRSSIALHPCQCLVFSDLLILAILFSV